MDIVETFDLYTYIHAWKFFFYLLTLFINRVIPDIYGPILFF